MLDSVADGDGVLCKIDEREDSDVDGDKDAKKVEERRLKEEGPKVEERGDVATKYAASAGPAVERDRE